MIEKILLKIFRRKFIRNYRRYCAKRMGYALFYYKTDAFLLPRFAERYSHTNHWEALEIARILNRLGFWIDIIDRTADISRLRLEDKYGIFIGIGAGDSGRYYADIASKVPSAVKIFYALGPEPDLSNELIRRRYDYFHKRHPGKEVMMRRLIKHVDIQKAMSVTDVIFCNGDESTTKSYIKFGKPIERIYMSSSPKLNADIAQLRGRSPKKFLYFGGNGNIVKGLDLVIEAFSQLPEVELYICAPNEPDFNAVYADVLAQSKNIHWLGFIEVGGNVFNKITSECGYVILPSCSEGSATSVLACMRRGLVPVITYECGIDVGDFGHLIKDVAVEQLAGQIKAIAKTSPAELFERSIKTYLDSFKYTQAGFSESFEKALIKVLAKKYERH